MALFFKKLLPAFFIAFFLLLSPAVFAQEQGTDTTSQEEPEEVFYTPPPKKSIWQRLQFWKKDNNSQPELKNDKGEVVAKKGVEVNGVIQYDIEKPSDWHMDLSRYIDAKDEEFYRYGYALSNEQWVPVFFIRRFEMMTNQYQHTLVIKGKPEKLPRVKGIVMGAYGVNITNPGFEFQMPSVASTSRDQKVYDELKSLDYASDRIFTFGFEDLYWLDDMRKDTRNLAKRWNVKAGPTDGN